MTNNKDIPGYEGLYKATSDGKIISLPKKVPCPFGGFRYYGTSYLKAGRNKKNNGYWMVTLSNNRRKKTFSVHRLVMSAFLGERDLSIEHIDGNKLNNNLINLRYITHKKARYNGWIGLKNKILEGK